MLCQTLILNFQTGSILSYGSALKFESALLKLGLDKAWIISPLNYSLGAAQSISAAGMKIFDLIRLARSRLS